jgi:hypothetical protein
MNDSLKPIGHWKKIFLAATAVVFVALGLAFHVDNSLPGAARVFVEFLVFAGLLFAWLLGAAIIVKGFRWLISRQAWVIYLKLGIGILSLIVLFYSVEKWRGKRAWTKLQQEVEGRGEKLDLSDLSARDVPDDQNFASTPLFASLFEQKNNPTGPNGPRGSDAAKLPRLDLQIRSLAGTSLNRKKGGHDDWMEQEFIDLKHRQRFFHRTADFPSQPQPQEPAVDVLLALSKFTSELNEIHSASQRPYARFPIRYEKGFEAELPHLPILQNIGEVLTLRASAALALDRTEEALADVQTSLRLVNAVRQQPAQLTFLRCSTMLIDALQPIWEGLATRRWTESQLAAIQNQLEQMNFLADYAPALRVNTLLMMDFIDQIIPVSSARPSSVFFPEDDAERRIITVFRLLYPAGWSAQNQVGLYRFYLAWVPYVDPARHRVIPQDRLGVDIDFVSLDPFFPVFIAPKVKTIFRDASESFPAVQTAVDEASVACALERYRLANGHFPETLNALVSQYIKELPHDIMDGQPLRYRRTEDGQFVLYSVGSDGVDNGGQLVARRRNWRGEPEPMWQSGPGDWVWRYPATASVSKSDSRKTLDGQSDFQ